MATILVVDDRALNRDYLVTLLGYLGHTLIQACDGEEALETVRAAPPDLIITDIAMPRLSGVEFIERMQQDPGSADIPVIFYSATYRVPEARLMAKACRAAAVIPKPSDPEVIISAVMLALGDTLTGKAAPARAQGWNPALMALMDLQCALVEERDPKRMIMLVCQAAPNLVSAEAAVLGLESAETGVLIHVLVCGMDPSTTFTIGEQVPDAFADRVAEPAERRVWNPRGNPEGLGLPPGHSPVQSLLVVPLVGTKGRYGWMYLTNRRDGTPFTDTDEELLGLLARQAAIAYENDLLAVRASRDALTGLLNRFEFDAAIKRECERAQRQCSPLALVMTDVDLFKRCNDQYGHPAGDEVLRRIAAELEKSVRAYDLVFRYGGEEFVLLLPGATIEDALLRAEQCRNSVKELDIRYGGQAIGPITLSMGVAAFPEHGEEALLSAADKALYEAKQTGRDRSCVASKEID